MGWSAAARARSIAVRRGKHLKASTRAKISAKKRGKRHPHRGHVLSASTKAKISKKLRSEKHKGHKLSAATKAKLRAIAKARHRTAARKARAHTVRHAGPKRRPGPNNRVVLAKIARRSVRPSLMRITNATLLQKRLHARLLPPRRGLTNRRVIRSEHRRRRNR